MNAMSIDLVEVKRPELGDEFKKCDGCDGKGYVEQMDGEDDFTEETCQKCEGAGVVELEASDIF
jgi:DnaJ-class molecular chaperone